MMSKTDLIETLSRKTGQTKKECGEIVNGFFEVIGDALAHGESVQLIGFGAFGIAKTKARTIAHPETGDLIRLPAGRRPKFTAGTKLKAAVNKRQAENCCDED